MAPSTYQIPKLEKEIIELKDEIEGLKKNLMYVVNALVKHQILAPDLTIKESPMPSVSYPARTDAVIRNEERIEKVH